METGAKNRGWLWLCVDGTTATEFARPRNLVEVSFQALLSREYVATHVLVGVGGPMQHFVGSGGEYPFGFVHGN